MISCRNNHLGAAGWEVVMDSLDTCTRLSCLNGFGRFRDISNGRLTTIDLNGTELGLAIIPFLPRNAETLTSLDLR